MTKQSIIEAIEAHAEKFGLKPSSVCQMAIQDRLVYSRLKQGGDIAVGRAEKLLAYLKADAAARSAKSSAQ